MRRICLVHKNDERTASLAAETEARLAARGLELWRESTWDEHSPARPQKFKPDLVVSLGGDGTLLYAARTWGLSGAPILGVNMGRLGFLAETEQEYFEEDLERCLAGDFAVERRFALEAKVFREGRPLFEKPAVVLNDVVVNKGHLARIVSINVNVPGQGRWNYRADGLIVATPTGSTAYNLSAGGPVVHPAVPAIIVTPICPFGLTSRPLILPFDFVVEVDLDGKSEDVYLSGDGQVSISLEPGDRIVVRRAKTDVKLVVSPRRNFLGILRHKLNWTLETGGHERS